MNCFVIIFNNSSNNTVIIYCGLALGLAGIVISGIC